MSDKLAKHRCDDVIHILKIWPDYFNAIISGVKRFEIRKIDDCKVGDLLSLHEYCPESKDFTGRVTSLLEVVYISEFEQKPGYKVLGFVMKGDVS